MKTRVSRLDKRPPPSLHPSSTSLRKVVPCEEMPFQLGHKFGSAKQNSLKNQKIQKELPGCIRENRWFLCGWPVLSFHHLEEESKDVFFSSSYFIPPHAFSHNKTHKVLSVSLLQLCVVKLLFRLLFFPSLLTPSSH